MKAITQHIGGIKCDRKGCGYRDDEAKFSDYKLYLNKPCPDCGDSLLTQADYDACVLMFAAIDRFNNSIIGRFIGRFFRNEPKAYISLEMNGSGEIKPVVKEIIK